MINEVNWHNARLHGAHHTGDRWKQIIPVSHVVWKTETLHGLHIQSKPFKQLEQDCSDDEAKAIMKYFFEAKQYVFKDRLVILYETGVASLPIAELKDRRKFELLYR